MDSTTSSSERERVYEVWSSILVDKGLSPIPRNMVSQKSLDSIMKLAESCKAEVEPFVRAQFDGCSMLDCARITLDLICKNAKKARNKYVIYERSHSDLSKDYRSDILRLGAAVSYYARVWQCDEQEVLSDNGAPIPAWYRAVMLRDSEIRKIYEGPAQDDLNNPNLKKAMEELGYEYRR